jgi:hypothetical protein
MVSFVPAAHDDSRSSCSRYTNAASSIGPFDMRTCTAGRQGTNCKRLEQLEHRLVFAVAGFFFVCLFHHHHDRGTRGRVVASSPRHGEVSCFVARSAVGSWELPYVRAGRRRSEKLYGALFPLRIDGLLLSGFRPNCRLLPPWPLWHCAASIPGGGGARRRGRMERAVTERSRPPEELLQ